MLYVLVMLKWGPLRFWRGNVGNGPYLPDAVFGMKGKRQEVEWEDIYRLGWSGKYTGEGWVM